ncbi:M15 family metallopeptidase [Planomonospora sp. ID67723]|uniref:M15 family metallopeptidase n=1 Tax=Planomonospora sp. ID67723 TaxID=2738134 RepID=UPI0018C41709|nr:M15 family metallopeptidase [Planomonospora sp. ID67723]MBG0828701.1 M15 family metallopeptidase [Planomonospora sp. ID67723]
MQEIVLMSDPRISSIPVEERGEPLTDLRPVPDLLLDGRLADPDGAYAHLRQGHVERLLRAQKHLPDGLRLLIVEGYRPLALQEQYFRAYAGRLREANPDWSDEHLYVQASRSLSPPHIGPHVCGAAVDLTLCTRDGIELDMGTEVNASPEESDDACYTDAGNITPQARRNRAVLSEVLTGAGFVNYPTEWWHWSYGDRYWAWSTGAPAAVHGQVDLVPATRAGRPGA